MSEIPDLDAITKRISLSLTITLPLADMQAVAQVVRDRYELLEYAKACQKMLAKHQHCEIDFPSSGCPECEWGHGLHAPDCELARLIGSAK